ncbi:MAG: hypothetical protein EOM23_04100 [Candidatus Moranbacteria bacterium]|nr:hypothetical protein [Candidatus Moranbacteria bacterium]
MIFIAGNVPSLKNGKVKGIYHPKTVTKYLRSLNIQSYSASKGIVKGYKDPNKPNLFIEQIGDYFKDPSYPLIIGTHFVRNSKRRFDVINAQQIIFDLMTAHHYLPDDNANYVIPVSFKINGKWFSIDKENPGVWLKRLDPKDFLDVKMKILQEHK